MRSPAAKQWFSEQKLLLKDPESSIKEAEAQARLAHKEGTAEKAAHQESQEVTFALSTD